MILSKSAGRQRGRSRGLGLWWTFTAGVVAAAAVIVAIVQNSHHVRLHYLAWHLNVSLIVVVLTTALAAVCLDEVGGLIWRGRRRSMLKRRTELEQLRADQPPAGFSAAEPAAASDLQPESGK